jgi:hypothetical protein
MAPVEYLNRFVVMIAMVSATFFATTGCGSNRPKDLPKLTPCELIIQYEDGSPVDAATVMMYPLEGNWYANGQTDSSGVAKMSTQGSFAGVAPGDYKVTVKKQEIIYPPGYDPGGENEGLPDATVNNYVDEQFLQLAKTPLKVTVAGQPVKETFQVKKSK